MKVRCKKEDNEINGSVLRVLLQSNIHLLSTDTHIILQNIGV